MQMNYITIYFEYGSINCRCRLQLHNSFTPQNSFISVHFDTSGLMNRRLHSSILKPRISISSRSEGDIPDSCASTIAGISPGLNPIKDAPTISVANGGVTAIINPMSTRVPSLGPLPSIADDASITESPVLTALFISMTSYATPGEPASAALSWSQERTA